MPIKPARREADIASALKLMIELQGDQPLHGVVFRPSQPELAALAPTTWADLKDDGFIEDRGERPGPTYRLTPEGWLAALERTGALELAPVRERAIKIRTALKALVQRTAHYPQHINVRTLADDLGLPRGWVHAAMKSDLLQTLFPDDLMNATLDIRNGLLISIPPNFATKQR